MVTTHVLYQIGGVSSREEDRRSYAQYVNPIWVKLLDVLNLGRRAMSL